MNKTQRSRCPTFWIGLAAGFLALVASISYSLHRPASGHFVIKISDKGVAWVGPIPLRNQKFRDLAFTALHRASPKTRFEVATSEKAPFTNVTAVVGSLISSGVPVCTMMTWAKPPSESGRAAMAPDR
jgi:hypothetical protein